MAEHLDNALLVRPQRSYSSIRRELQSGDLLFCSGDYLVSRAIRQFTNSPWSHVGIILRVESIDRILLLESVEDMGVRFAPLSKYIDDYDVGRPYMGTLVFGRVSGLKTAQIPKIAQFGADELTRPYDKSEIGKIVARIALGVGRSRRDREYICSELVYECFSNAGVTFEYDSRGFVSPENIWANQRIKPLWRLKL